MKRREPKHYRTVKYTMVFYGDLGPFDTGYEADLAVKELTPEDVWSDDGDFTLESNKAEVINKYTDDEDED